MVGRGRLFLPEIVGQINPVGAKSIFGRSASAVTLIKEVQLTVKLTLSNEPTLNIVHLVKTDSRSSRTVSLRRLSFLFLSQALWV